MGVDYRAKLVAGFEIANATDKSQVRGCAHAGGPGNFCAVCGKPMWVERAVNRLEDFSHRKFDVFNPNTLDFEGGADLPPIVGKDVGRHYVPDADQLVTLEAELRSVLDAQHLTPEGPFALHLVRYVSY